MNQNNAITNTCKVGPIKEIVLLGGGGLLRKLSLWAKSENILVKIVTSPRHEKEVLDNEKLSDFLNKNKIEYIAPEDIGDNLVKAFLSNSKEAFFLSCGAAWIFKGSIIFSLFQNRLFNLHSTDLPKNRGGGGFSWQIMMGIKTGYCTLHLIDGGIDTGPIVESEKFLFPPNAKKPIDFENVSIKKNFEFLINFIKKYRSQTATVNVTHQEESLSSYWPRLNTDLNSWINWSYSIEELVKFISAFDNPYNGAQTLLNGKKVRIKNVYSIEENSCFHSYQNGIVYRKDNNCIFVAMKNSTLVVQEIYDENNNKIFEEVKVGDRFVTPSKKLEFLHSRVVYTPTGLKKIYSK